MTKCLFYVELPKELKDEYDVDYGVENGITKAKLKKKFDLDSIEFKNLYENLHPISQILKANDIEANSIEFWHGDCLMINLSCFLMKPRSAIAKALNVPRERVKQIRYNQQYCVLKNKR